MNEANRHIARLLSITLIAGIASLAACTDDPRYVEPAGPLLAGPAEDEDAPPVPPVELWIPIRLENTTEASDRSKLATELGVDVPFIGHDDLDLSLEWTITNLEEEEAEVRIRLTGANEYFSYTPANLIVDPEEDALPPPLLGDIPLLIPGQGSIRGVFREDQMREMAIDLELITRGGLNPFAATLQHQDGLAEIEVEGGTTIPAKAFANLVRIDVALLSNRQVRMEYVLRARSHVHPGLLHDKGVAAAEGELTVFAPADYVPPPPEET